MPCTAPARLASTRCLPKSSHRSSCIICLYVSAARACKQPCHHLEGSQLQRPWSWKQAFAEDFSLRSGLQNANLFACCLTLPAGLPMKGCRCTASRAFSSASEVTTVIPPVASRWLCVNLPALPVTLQHGANASAYHLVAVQDYPSTISNQYHNSSRLELLSSTSFLAKWPQSLLRNQYESICPSRTQGET